MRGYLRYNLSYRDGEELLVERGMEVDHVTVCRWVQRFTPLLADAARFCRHSPGGRWHVDETYIKVNGSRDVAPLTAALAEPPPRVALLASCDTSGSRVLTAYRHRQIGPLGRPTFCQQPSPRLNS
ncbi:hypothetical protein GCM10022255_109200 [Dactylosporangium darangshiense]|uniref:DDE domain-containing protein n=1 Tax=Dactylosporangium darangshiense TaxID=579108 RepID=A0ABP8DV31_9ACTN